MINPDPGLRSRRRARAERSVATTHAGQGDSIVVDFGSAKKIMRAVRLASTPSGAVTEISLPTERRLISRWQRHGDQKALLQLVMTMQPFLRKVARRHGARTGIEADLINEGVMAIIEALGRYQPVEQARFVSFAWRRVVTAMSRARRRTERIVDRPPEKHRGQCPAAASSAPGAGSHSSIDEVDEAILLSNALNPERLLAEAERNRDLSAIIEKAIEDLTVFERELIICRLQDGNLDELAHRHGSPPDLARRIEARALQKMRMKLITNGYSGVNRDQTCWQE